MTRVRFTLPQVKLHPDTRPPACPHCGSVFLNRHGAVAKPVKDLYVSQVTVHRYRCVDCRRTFRHYPQGVDGHDQSLRLRGLAALSWALGLSLRSTSHLLAAMGRELSRMSVWRDVQESGSGALSGWLSRARGQVRLMGADETVVKLKGEKTVVGFVTDAESGRLVGMDVLVERDGEGFVRWLEGYVGKFGVEAMVTDDLSTYKPVVERLGVDHQSLPRARHGVCIAHVRENVHNRLERIKGWEWYKARIWMLLSELPEWGGRELLDGASGEGRACAEAAGGGVVSEVEEPVMPPASAGYAADQQLYREGDRQKQDKIQDHQRVQEHEGDDERIGTDAVGMEWRGRP